MQSRCNACRQSPSESRRITYPGTAALPALESLSPLHPIFSSFQEAVGHTTTTTTTAVDTAGGVTRSSRPAPQLIQTIPIEVARSNSVAHASGYKPPSAARRTQKQLQAASRTSAAAAGVGNGEATHANAVSNLEVEVLGGQMLHKKCKQCRPAVSQVRNCAGSQVSLSNGGASLSLHPS